MAKLSELLNKLDADKNVRGNQFEHICKWYLENDPKYALELKKVWLWDDWPGKWGPDAGIDLVAKTYDNKLWAVQAKAYNPDHSIRKSDIDSFLSESSRKTFSYRLLITTARFIGRTAEQTLHSQEKPVGTVLLSDLEKSAVKWPISPEKLEAKPPELKKPRPHQQKAITDVFKGFSDNNRGQLIMACGTGKTLVALWAAVKLQSQRILILLPSLSLLAQTLREWTANTSQPFQYLPVCSDDTVRGADHFTSRTSDLGLPVTTNPDEVAEFLLRRGPIVVFATYQSSPVIAEAFSKGKIPTFDLAIADEAHRCAGIGSGPFSTILDRATIRARRRLFMTATPRIFRDPKNKKAKDIDFELASMDDEVKFGPVFHRLSFSKAIRQDLLSDYQVVVVGVDDATYRRYAKHETYVSINGKKATDARSLACQIALVKAMKKYDLKRVISFHGRIKRAKEFSEQFSDTVRWMPQELCPQGPIWSSHVSGEMSSGRRDVLLNRFRNLEEHERGLLSNARCLGEGIDVPPLDSVAFIDPRHSQVDIVQAVGRAIRKDPDKKIGTVVVPIFVKTNEDAEVVLESSIFKSVWDVLKALRAHDDILVQSLDQLRRQSGHSGRKGLNLPHKLIIDLPLTVGQSFAESFVVKLVEQTTSVWEYRFGQLEDYVERNGHSIVPRKYVTEDGFHLGLWVQEQRRAYRYGNLQRERKEAFEQLEGWTWEPREAVWLENFQNLCMYVARNGHTSVPMDYNTEDGSKLGVWVHSQRIAYRDGRLSKERQQALEQLPSWRWDRSPEANWFENILKLYKYVYQSGYSIVPLNYVTKDGFRLGQWVRRQQRAYERGELPKHKQEALEQLPKWKWKFSPDIIWLENLQHLQKYAEREGHSNVPSKYISEDGFNLGSWISRQRTAYRQGRLLEDRKRALEQLPGWIWDARVVKWFENFKHLREYAKHKGHFPVPLEYVTEDGFHLGLWIRVQQENYYKDKLNKEQERAFQEVPGWVWTANRKTPMVAGQ